MEWATATRTLQVFKRHNVSLPAKFRFAMAFNQNDPRLFIFPFAFFKISNSKRKVEAEYKQHSAVGF
jgi:hypothetical protein